MSADNHANYTLIGMTVLAGLVAIVASLIYIGGIRGSGDVLYVETYYDKPVNGLSVGSEVNFRGVKVGKVKEISFVGCKYHVTGIDASKIYILMAVRLSQLGNYDDFESAVVEARKAISRGMHASVCSSGITGVSHMECDFFIPGDGEPPDFKPSWEPKNLYIPAKSSLLENFSVSATKVMNQINRMDMAGAWSNIAFAVESIAKLSHTTQTLVDGQQADVKRIVENMTEMTESTKQLINEIRMQPSMLVHPVQVQPLPETAR